MFLTSHRFDGRRARLGFCAIGLGYADRDSDGVGQCPARRCDCDNIIADKRLLQSLDGQDSVG